MHLIMYTCACTHTIITHNIILYNIYITHNNARIFHLRIKYSPSNSSPSVLSRRQQLQWPLPGLVDKGPGVGKGPPLWDHLRMMISEGFAMGATEGQIHPDCFFDAWNLMPNWYLVIIHYWRPAKMLTHRFLERYQWIPASQKSTCNSFEGNSFLLGLVDNLWDGICQLRVIWHRRFMTFMMFASFSLFPA